MTIHYMKSFGNFSNAFPAGVRGNHHFGMSWNQCQLLNNTPLQTFSAQLVVIIPYKYYNTGEFIYSQKKHTIKKDYQRSSWWRKSTKNIGKQDTSPLLTMISCMIVKTTTTTKQIGTQSVQELFLVNNKTLEVVNNACQWLVLPVWSVKCDWSV